MDIVEGLLARYSYLISGNKKDVIGFLILLQAVTTFAFVICSFVVAGTANMGFNCVLTGFLNIALVAGAHYVVENSKSPIAVGFLIGTAGMMTILSFMTAVFWGQLSRCEEASGITQYTCTNKVAYGAVCAFSIILFLLQGAFTAGVAVWRGELINESGVYDDISSGPSNPHPSNYGFDPSSKGGFSSSVPPPSADL